jgi:hypothetical protein
MFKMSVRPSCGRHITTSEVALLLLWSHSHRHNSPHAPNALGPPSLPAAPILNPNTYETKLVVIPGTVPGSDGSREPRVVRSWMYCLGPHMMLIRRCGGHHALRCPTRFQPKIPPATPTASHNRAVAGDGESILPEQRRGRGSGGNLTSQPPRTGHQSEKGPF